MFTAIQNSNKQGVKGFQMTFANGNTISVMFGDGNYCGQQINTGGVSKNETAEIAICNNDGKWYDFGNDTVKGWLTTDEVAEWINLAANNTF